MKASEALEKVLPSYQSYYDIKREGVLSPFVCEAEFRSHSEKYVLVKSAKIADIDSNEFIYFLTKESLDVQLLNQISLIAWENGLKKVSPYYGHMNSDITLIIIAENCSEDLKKAVKKLRMSKNYKFGLYGWSNFKICVLDLNAGKAFSNYVGRDIKKIFYKLGLSSCK